MTLIRLLPFMVGTFVDDDDDDHWECFTLLCTISNLVCAFEATLEDSIYLAWIIETYLESFRLIYPTVMMIPKMHYLVHLPDQIVKSVQKHYLIFITFFYLQFWAITSTVVHEI